MSIIFATHEISILRYTCVRCYILMTNKESLVQKNEALIKRESKVMSM